MKKSCWITGSTGFIGKYLTSTLKNYYNVTCIINEKEDKKSSSVENIDSLVLDFSSQESINNVISTYGCPEILIHAGWGNMAQPMSKEHIIENVLESKLLIKIFYESGLIKFIFFGSMNEYGSLTGSLSEDDIAAGKLTNYAKAKTIVANYGFKIANKKKRVFLHIRPFYVYGAGQRSGSLINELFLAHTEKRPTKIGPCENFRDYVYVEDVVEGIRRLLNIENSLTVNIGNGSYIKVKDFVKLFWKYLKGKPCNLQFGYLDKRSDEPDQPKSFANLNLLKRLINWQPTYSIDSGIKKTINIMSTHKGDM